jgi:hypothetical protein
MLFLESKIFSNCQGDTPNLNHETRERDCILWVFVAFVVLSAFEIGAMVDRLYFIGVTTPQGRSSPGLKKASRRVGPAARWRKEVAVKPLSSPEL